MLLDECRHFVLRCFFSDFLRCRCWRPGKRVRPPSPQKLTGLVLTWRVESCKGGWLRGLVMFGALWCQQFAPWVSTCFFSWLAERLYGFLAATFAQYGSMILTPWGQCFKWDMLQVTRVVLQLHVFTCVALAGGCTSECDDSGMLQRLPSTALVKGAGIRPRFRGRGSERFERLKRLARQRGFLRGSGKLFISAEASGFVDMREENAIPFLRGKFDTAALIYLTVSHIGMMDFYAEAQQIVKRGWKYLSIPNLGMSSKTMG